MILTAYNPSTDHLEKSYLSNAYPVGTTSIVVRNNSQFAVNDRVLLGEMGREKSEIVTVSAANADKVTMTIGATKFPHSADDSVIQLKYDEINFYRSTTGIDGSYSALASVPLDVDNADLATKYNDPSGLSGYYYKISFYHSIAAVESSLSDPMPGTGYARTQVGALINDFLTDVNDLQQDYITVPQILSFLNECNDDLSLQAMRPYRFLKTSDLLSIETGNNRVALPENLLKFQRIKYNSTFPNEDRIDNIRIIDIEEMEYLAYDQTAMLDDGLQYMAIDETTNELVLYPVPLTDQTDVFQIYYWARFATIDSLGDSIQLPTPRAYKLFLMFKFYRMRASKENAFLQQSDRYAQEYSTEVVKLQRNNRLDAGSPQGYRPDTQTARGLRKY